MAGPNLPVNNDAAYADSTADPSVKTHQQHHDALHALANLFDMDTPRADGDALVWDAAQGLWVATSLTGQGGGAVPTGYSTAAPGTVFRVVWSGSWPATRPSQRSDIYFDCVGGPSSAAPPVWLLNGDNMLPPVDGNRFPVKARRGTDSSLSTVTLAAGELGYATDTRVLKVGDGTQVWTSLPAVTGTGSGGQTSVGSLQDIPDGVSRVAMTPDERTKLAGIQAGATRLLIGTTAGTAKAGDFNPTPESINAVRAVDGPQRWWRTRPAGAQLPTAAEGALDGDNATQAAG